MSASSSNRPTSRLETARVELLAAKAEHVAAFAADGFSPTRADKAESRLAAAQARFEDELEWERGQGERRAHEIKIENQERRLAVAERGLRAVEWKLRDACRAANIDTRGLVLEDIARWIASQREAIKANLAKRDLKPTRRVTIERQDQLLAEAEYRLAPVVGQTEQVARIRDDIALLQGGTHAAK
jgi:hypothetical protein